MSIAEPVDRVTLPKRLSDVTHTLAARALSGVHGRRMEYAAFIQCAETLAGLSQDMQYAIAARCVAENAPIWIQPGERLVGSATLREAPEHRTPALDVGSVSHTTLGFHRILKIGYRGLRQQIMDRLERGNFDDVDSALGGGEDLLRAMLICLDAASCWHKRYMDMLEERIVSSEGDEAQHIISLRNSLRNVPERPPETFREAVQSLWFMYAFQRLMGNWSGLGRVDEMLGSYLQADLAAKHITLDEARELLAHFWIKGCEWIGVFDTRGSGDAQHYQNVVLGGVDTEGNEVTNEVTYLILDVVEELHISDFPIAVRLNTQSPEKLLRRIAEVQRRGGGIVAIYNEDKVIEGLVKFGYPLEEARTFANDGCWEVIIPGRTAFSYVPFDALVLLNEVLGVLDSDQPIPWYVDFETLLKAFEKRLRRHLESIAIASDNWANFQQPTPLISLFVEDCIERACGYYGRGARYNVQAPHAGRLANVANSLLAIQRLVYVEKCLTLAELVSILRLNWDGNECLRQYVRNEISFYGNDDDAADAMMQRVFNLYTDIVAEVKERNGVLRPAGISTFGREIDWSLDERGGKPTADGHRAGTVLATNFSPSPGTDKKGPTALIKSYCKMDFTRTPNGATLELKIHPASVKGEPGVMAMVGLMRSFVALGGFFMQTDVVDTAMLQEAQLHPERYPNLSVRISGWSARFATMDKYWQDMIIGRTQQFVQ